MLCAALPVLGPIIMLRPIRPASPPVRYAVLSSGKTLLTPQPRLRTGFFSRLHRDGIPAQALQEACSSGGCRCAGCKCLAWLWHGQLQGHC